MRTTLALLAATAAAGQSDTTPVQLHLSWGGPGAVRAAWKTNSTSAPSTCSYGRTAGSMNLTSTGTSVVYFPGHGAHHSVKLAGLAPSTTYFYSCAGSNATSFTSPPAPNASAPFSALIFGDMGYLDSVQRGGDVIPVAGMNTNWSATLTFDLISTLASNASFDWSWIVGDIAYADDAAWYWADLLNFNYEDVYDGFMSWFSPITSRLPMMVSVGNHESECHSPYCILNLNSTGLYLNNFTAYNARWAMPAPESGGVGGMWYSWDHGRVHLVSLDTSTDFPNAPEGSTGDSHFPFFPAGGFAPNGTYMAWLEADLAAAVANGATWIIAGGHRPVEDFDSAPLIALFAKYGVDAYFTGHGHSYARYSADTYGDNTVHVMVGGSGCDEMPWPADQLTEEMEEDSFPSPRAACEAWCAKPEVRRAFAGEGRVGMNETVLDVAPASDPCRYCTAGGRSAAGPVYVSDNMAIGQLTVTYSGNSSTLLWRLLRAPDGKVLDSFTLTKPL